MLLRADRSAAQKQNCGSLGRSQIPSHRGTFDEQARQAKMNAGLGIRMEPLVQGGRHGKNGRHQNQSHQQTGHRWLDASHETREFMMQFHRESN